MSRFLNVLRSWLVMVSVIAAGNTLQSFRDHSFLSEKLYTGTPGLVNGLQARTFGIWTLLSSVIRCLCAIDIRNTTLMSRRPQKRVLHAANVMSLAACFGLRLFILELLNQVPFYSSGPYKVAGVSLYYITLFTFFMALVHFLSEVFIYHTAALTIGVMAPLMVASFSILGMLIGLQYLEVEALSENKKKN